MSNLSNQTSGVRLEETESNMFLGVIGALVGAMLGAVLWIVLYQFGVIAYIAGIAIVYLSCKGFFLLSKKESLGGVIIAIIISIIVLVATHFFCWGLDIYQAFSGEYEITIVDAVLAVPSIAFTGEYVVDFVKELAIGFLLIGLGAAPFVRQTRRQQAKNME